MCYTQNFWQVRLREPTFILNTGFKTVKIYYHKNRDYQKF